MEAKRITVEKCQHTGVRTISNQNGTHTLDCPDCGSKDQVNCTYDFSEATGTCAACKDSVTVNTASRLCF